MHICFYNGYLLRLFKLRDKSSSVDLHIRGVIGTMGVMLTAMGKLVTFVGVDVMKAEVLIEFYHYIIYICHYR